MIERINEVLSTWDPIEVGHPLSCSEYKQYASGVLSVKDNRDELKVYIIWMLNQMGIEVDETNQDQLNEINALCEKLNSLK